MFRHIVLATVVATLTATAAQAALLTGVEGQVSVNRGNGFERVTAPTDVKPGDRVMVGPAGNAKIVYNEACTARIQASTVIVVAKTVPCQLSALDAAAHGTDTAGPGAGVGGLGNGLLIGGALIAGGVGLAILLKEPASP
jgi:hypothetical protein